MKLRLQHTQYNTVYSYLQRFFSRIKYIIVKFTGIGLFSAPKAWLRLANRQKPGRIMLIYFGEPALIAKQNNLCCALFYSI